MDVVLGTHPHVIGPVEEKVNAKGEKTLVVYSTGNYISAMYGNDNMMGYTATFDFVKNGDKKKIENIKMIPTVTYYDQGWSNFKIYKLDNYTDDIAARHMIYLSKGENTSPAYYRNLFESTVASNYR